MMGGQSSKTGGGSSGNSPPVFQMSSHSLTADLSSYEAACKNDPKLQILDATIQERTNRVIDSLSTGLEVRSISFDSLREVTNSLLEMNQEVVKVILDCKRDIWNSQDMFSLVEDYFENSIKTLDFCTALERCLKRTRDNQLIVKLALKYYEEEVENGLGGMRYMKTLEELRRFKEAGDPFTEEFYILFQEVYKQQMLMFGKMQARKRKLDKKLKSLKTWRRVSNAIFVTAFVSVLIFSVVAAAIAAPPVVAAVAGALAVPIGSVGKWCNSLWKGYENALRGQREIISNMQVGTYIAMKDLDNIRVLVNKLEIEMESLLQNAEFALGEEDALRVRLAVDEIRKKLEGYMETTQSLGERVDKCSQDITKARIVIIQKIIKHPSD